jgi:hypothetical protein
MHTHRHSTAQGVFDLMFVKSRNQSSQFVYDIDHAVSALTRVNHRLENLHVSRAPAKIAGKSFTNRGLVGMRIIFQQTDGCDYHSRGADAALRPAAFDKGLLHGVQLSLANRNSFDRFDRAAGDLGHRHETTVHQLSVDQNAARPTLAFAASFFGSRKVQLLAQHIE